MDFYCVYRGPHGPVETHGLGCRKYCRGKRKGVQKVMQRFVEGGAEGNRGVKGYGRGAEEHKEGHGGLVAPSNY